MASVPFVYFTLLFFYVFLRNHKKIDIACFILAIYASSAFFSILVDRYGYSYYPSYVISFEATFAYCSLLTISVVPFINYSNLKISKIEPIVNEKILVYSAYIVFGYFLVYLYMSANDVYNVLTGDIGTLRAAHYTENISSGWLAKMNPIVRIPFVIFNLVMGAPWILQFLGFYTIIIQRLHIKYGILFIVASLIGVVGNLSEAGRSDLVYWIIGMIACLIFFKPYLDNSEETAKKVRILGYILIGAALFVIGLITFSRYENRDSGAEGGFITYFGQPFNHFAYFFDKYACPYPTLEILFPFTYNILGISEGGVVAVQQMLTLRTGVFTGLFYTYIGQIAVTSSNSVAVLFCAVYSLFSNKLCKENIKCSSAKSTFIYMTLASIMFLGLFSHYYGIMNKTASVMIWYFIISNNMKSKSNNQ